MKPIKVPTRQLSYGEIMTNRIRDAKAKVNKTKTKPVKNPALKATE